ncbi:family 43 glycosylhydrolase [Dysgonomonas macrotermitis]|uniref:Glycosyl hydrolases family 43 n=1 Tax=Dysgonomonas macrotermitis TaxID=1346286 RepID=A0A1M4TKQ1_9BACT|nr:family 43 glycosylhydrolase [Dysgonomonas macrotermitis]SHE44975.1 Glycosyl hydrolases family 43 [Dysgonomonas macrotermitis]
MRVLAILLLNLVIVSLPALSQEKGGRYNAITSGVAWFDQNNKEINAHGACIVKEGDRYYLFGEYKSDTSNAFTGFSCYSSTDLVNWTFENVVLPQQKAGLLGPDRVGERVKVMKCPSTGEFVMYMHCDDMGYKDPHVGYATCKTISGDYQFHGDLLLDGKYLKRWDLGTFQDSDGKGYVLTHEGFIYELADDYKSVNRIVVSDMAHGGESPAMFRANGYYFWLFSNKTSWERNDNYYLVSKSLEGSWINKGNFAPIGSLTWNSQSSFVLPVVGKGDTLNMYMGDRWSYPKQGSAGTYVWQPITVTGDEMSIPVFQGSWSFDRHSQWLPIKTDMKSVKKDARCIGNWSMGGNVFKSNEKGAQISVPFKGSRISVKGLSNNTSGYASVVLKNGQNEEVLNTIVDFYSLYENSSLKFNSPVLAQDNYTLTIEVLGEHPAWSDKRKSDYGSTDNYIIIEDIYIK